MTHSIFEINGGYELWDLHINLSVIFRILQGAFFFGEKIFAAKLENDFRD